MKLKIYKILNKVARWLHTEHPFLISFVILFLIIFVSWQTFSLTFIDVFENKIKINDALSLLSYFILSFTFIAILWYTLETRVLKKLQHKQINLNLRPLIIADVFGDTNKKMVIKNVGAGAAINIKVSCQNNFFKNLEGIKQEFEFVNYENIITKDQISEIEINYRAFSPYSEVAIDWKSIPFEYSYFKDKSNLIIIEYEDIEKNIYRSEIVVSEKRLIFKESYQCY